MYYDTTNNEIGYSTTNSVGVAKTFVIDHPLDPAQKHLVHVCLEGPEAGVYYRGKAVIDVAGKCVVELPEYVPALARDFTVQLQQIVETEYDPIGNLRNTEVKDGKFTVFGAVDTKFHWLVMGKRGDVEVEPLKKDCVVKGDGPYKYIV